MSGTALAESGLDFLKLKEGSQVFLLGEGSTARVFRIVAPSGASYLLRKYQKMDRNAHEDFSESNFRRDATHLRAFRQAALNHGPTETVEVAESAGEFEGARASKQKDVKGFSFQRVLDLLKTENPEARAKLAADFNRRLKVMVEDLREAGYRVEAGGKDRFDPDIDSYHVSLERGVRHSVGLPDNVIYDPQTGRFVMVDPF